WGSTWINTPDGPRLIVDEDVPAAMAGDPERQLTGPIERLADRPMPPRGGDQEQEAPAAGTQQVAADGAGLPGGLVPVVDPVVADPEAQGPLELPALVQEGRESVEVPISGQGPAHLAGQVAHLAKHPHAVARTVGLPLEDLIGIPGLPRVDQECSLLQLGQGLRPTGHRLDVHGLVAVEADVVDPAIRRRVLVLAADGFFERVDLDPAGLLGQELRADD